LIRAGEVTVAGKPITSPHYLLSLDEASSAVKISGKLVMLKKNAAVGQGTVKTRVWLAHKLPGEVVSDHDPQNRPSLLTRLKRGGVGTKEDHLKAIGRLDIPTEGLVVVTNDGKYKRDLELPTNMVHRVYRARVHGKLTENKLKAIRNGMTIDNVTYRGMKVQIEVTRKSSSTNSWLRLTCTEGKNRQVRKVLAHLSLNVTRLIRISYGDYKLDTIPPGMALEVPVKLLASQKKSGRLIDVRKGDNSLSSARGVKAKDNDSSAIQWVRPI
jgi:23S rRNA pseudouridine2605 synthase